MKRNVESSIIIALSSHIYDIVIICCNADDRHLRSFFWCYVKKRKKFLKTDFPVCLLPGLECLNGRMDETLCFLLSERKGTNVNYVGCQVLQQTIQVNIFVRSQTAINLFENTCEHIRNLSKVAGNKNNNLPAIQ